MMTPDDLTTPEPSCREVRDTGARFGHVLNMLFAVALMLAVATTLVACGKKGDPTLPGGKKDDFPASYPKSSDPQTGVFSG